MEIVRMICIFVIILVIVLGARSYRDKDMVSVKADFDGEYYLVRDCSDKKRAANLLARLKKNIYDVTSYIDNKVNVDPRTKNTKRYTDFKPYSDQLKKRIQGVEIMESSKNSTYTSYCVNKGEQIVFCIRSKDISRAINEEKIHDINLVMYVLLHEISHVACPEKNHTPLFKKIFYFICEEAIEMGIYKRIDFRNDPQEYCGMKITDSII